jgi:hypothetical protein
MTKAEWLRSDDVVAMLAEVIHSMGGLSQMPCCPNPPTDTTDFILAMVRRHQLPWSCLLSARPPSLMLPPCRNQRCCHWRRGCSLLGCREYS